MLKQFKRLKLTTHDGKIKVRFLFSAFIPNNNLYLQSEKEIQRVRYLLLKKSKKKQKTKRNKKKIKNCEEHIKYNN